MTGFFFKILSQPIMTCLQPSVGNRRKRIPYCLGPVFATHPNNV